MLRWVADERVPIALKSFSADQPSGRTGSGRESVFMIVTIFTVKKSGCQDLSLLVLFIIFVAWFGGSFSLITHESLAR